VSNRRKKSWPSGFYSDGLSYRMKTADGRFVRLGSNEARALRKFHQARRLEDAGDSIGAVASPRMTLRAVAERWFEAQSADGVRDVGRDIGRFRNHIDPLIGSRRVGDIEARDLLLMIRELKRLRDPRQEPRPPRGATAARLTAPRRLNTARGSSDLPRACPDQGLRLRITQGRCNSRRSRVSP